MTTVARKNAMNGVSFCIDEAMSQKQRLREEQHRRHPGGRLAPKGEGTGDRSKRSLPET